MNKRFIYAAGSLLLVAGSAAYAAGLLQTDKASPRTPEEIAAIRAERKASHPKGTAPKAPQKRVYAGDKPLYGAMYSTQEHFDYFGFTGPVQISATGEHAKLSTYALPNAFSGCYYDGKFLQSFHNAETGGDVIFAIYDATNWNMIAGPMTFTGDPVKNLLPYAMAYDHTSGRIYGCFFADADDWWFATDKQFGYIDLENNMFDPVTIVNDDLPERMRAMVFDKDGQLYGLAFSGQMYTINKFTGAATPTVNVDLYSCDGSADAPFSGYGRESMACDWETGDFYLSYGDDYDDSYIARINPQTGESETIADYSYGYSDGWLYGDLFTGLYFIQEAEKPAEQIPAAVSNLSVTAEGTLLKANVSFTLPSVDTEGEALDAELTWIVSDGADQLGEGIAHSGDNVTTTVDVNKAGQNEIVVYTTLNGVESRTASLSVFIGCDTPIIPGLPTVRASGSKLTVTWMEAYAANNGNLDPVTYQLTRLPDNKVVAEAVSGTSYTDELESDIKTKYSYLITPKSGSVSGEPVESRSIFAGKYLAMPHFNDFKDESLFLQYPVIDANNDNNIWEYSTKYNGIAMYPANENPADDYLLIGPFKMVEGGSYTFHAVLDSHNMTEYVSIAVGTDPDDAASFSHELVPSTSLTYLKGKTTFDVSYEPETSGDYYFAVHACTPYASQFIYLYEVGVKALGGAAPDAPGNLDIIPGATTATINFTMPKYNIDGSLAESLSEARVYRDGALIGSLTENIAPEAALSFTDEEEVSKGYHIYSVVAVNAEGEGKTVSQQIYRGLDIPGRPTNFRLWEDAETPGIMHATFDHPARGFYGGYVDPEQIEYHIDYLVMGAGSGDIYLGKGTSHSFEIPVDCSKQDIFAGSVYGANAAGSIAKSGNWTTQVAYFGPAISLPVAESWPGQTQRSGIWAAQPTDENEGLGDTYWDVSSGTLAAINPQDRDGGMLSLTTKVEGGGKRILSPRFSMEDAANPTIVLYYNYTTDAIDFALEAIADDNLPEILHNFDLTPANAGNWTRLEIPLSDYKNAKYLQLGFLGHGHPGEEFVAIDNVTISDLRGNDIAIKAFEAPTKVIVNEAADLTATIRNVGGDMINGEDFTVQLYKNGKLVAEQNGQDLAADEETVYAFTEIASVADPEINVYYVEIAFPADNNLSNNTSVEKEVRVVIADYPTVSDLQGVEGEQINLSWTAPDMSEIPGESVTENFDSYEAFIIDNIGNWTVYDGDKAPTVVMATSMGLIEYPHVGEPMAWQVFDPMQTNIFSPAWTPRSGDRMLVSFQACVNNTRLIQSEDWLISPALNGAAQTVSFFSRAGLSTQVPEVFDFMVSSNGNAPEDFEVLAADVEVPYSGSEWFEYIYKVPAGTRHFAIVHKSYDKMGLLLDDVTYIPAGSSAEQLDLVGYNVYRDGVRLNDTPVIDSRYTDADVVIDQDYTYAVSAVWSKGESRLCEPVVVKAVSGVDSAVAYDLTITPLRGAIRIEGGIGEFVSVYSANGMLIATVKAQDTVEVEVPAPGVYIVKAPGAVAKVAVR